MKKMSILNSNSTIYSQPLRDDFTAELNRFFPNPICELKFNTLFELMICVMLSSQTLDRRVNEVSPIIFKTYPTLESMRDCNVEELEKIIRPLGLSKAKAQNIKRIATDIIEKFNSSVPTNFEELITLQGIGEKTAQVILIEGLNVPAFPVDTHVLRVCKRLGFIDETWNAPQTSQLLKENFEPDKWAKMHKQIVLFGRYHCTAKKPECFNCNLKLYCNYEKKDESQNNK